MDMRFALSTIATMLSVAVGEKCGYVRGPLAATNDTVVIKLDCNQSATSSHFVPPLQLRYDVTHVALQLLHCRTVPVGLFTNATDHLTSVTVASEDAVQLLEGTFEGLERISEFRLIGFTALKNLSRSVLKPLRNIRTVILDGFGRDRIELPDLGRVIRKLSGTPIRRLILNRIKGNSFFHQIMQINNFRISNVSVKELIITNAPLNYEGSIHRAFPDLVCFCGGGLLDEQTAVTFPALWELLFLSDQLKELVVYRPKFLPRRSPTKNGYNTPVKHFIRSVLMISKVAILYPDLLNYFHHIPHSEDCALGCVFKIGANMSTLCMNDLSTLASSKKPICVQENNLLSLDFTGSRLPGTIPMLIGLKKLEYLSLENTFIRSLPTAFLQHYPSLKVLKLSRLGIDDYIRSNDENLFGSCPTLSEIYLDACNMTKIPTKIFSKSVSLQHIDLSKNYLRTVDLDLQSCTRLDSLNFSSNNMECITEMSMRQLTQLALRKTGENKLLVDLSHNKLHCLCNVTHFVKWLQRLPAEWNIQFHGFDRYTCLYPNGSSVRVSEVVIDELEQQCSVIQTLVNGSDCPCDEEKRRRLQHVRVHLDRFLCRNDDGDLVSMNRRPFPSCFNAYLRASFIAPVVVGAILGIAFLITVGLLIYYRNSKPVRQVRECLEMNPVRFVRTAIQYVMMHNREEEPAIFRFDVIVFVQDDEQGCIHHHFVQALQGKRKLITRDDFLPGAAEVDAMVECIRDCRWVVPVLTSSFLSDHVCVDFISRVQFSRPHALIPVVWEQSLAVTDISVAELLRTGDPLYWPGDEATQEDQRNFWSSLLEKTAPL